MNFVYCVFHEQHAFETMQYPAKIEIVFSSEKKAIRYFKSRVEGFSLNYESWYHSGKILGAQYEDTATETIHNYRIEKHEIR